MEMNYEWVQQSVSQSVAANQNSTSSIQITLLVNRFMLKGAASPATINLQVFHGNAVLQKHTTKLCRKSGLYNLFPRLHEAR
jgi:hypothetical protein